VAGIGAVLSFRSLYAAAVPTFGEYFAAGVPLLVDLLILGASLLYVAGAKVGSPMAGWRLTAHAGVVATLVLNALAARQVSQVPWHVAAPAVWAVLVELTAQQVLGAWKATLTIRTDTISLTLWLSAPVQSARIRLLMRRAGITDAHAARIAVGVEAAAREALRLALPDRHGRRVRRIISRQLRAGTLPPAAVLGPLGWDETSSALPDYRPETILRAVLRGVLNPATRSSALTPQPAHDTVRADPGADLVDNDARERPDRPIGRAEKPDRGRAVHASSGVGTRSEQRRRLVEAADIVQGQPDITGPGLREALADKGWTISKRTASRILPIARTEAEARRELALTTVSG
jgi:hypothetical protein